MGSGINELLAPEYEHLSYDEVFPDSATFITKVRGTTIISDTLITDAFLVKLFAMLFAKHGFDPIASSSEDIFVYKLALTTEEYAPTFLKKLDIQKSLRALNLDEIREGYKNIFNHAVNPSTTPSTDNTNELPYISDQNVNKGTKGKVDAYAYLWEILRNDVTEEFLKKYDKLFSRVATTTARPVYITDEEED